jgi:5-methylcytosine-specific restriction protein A
MSLADLTAECVHEAISEFDRLGRAAFLNTYGFGRARGYFLIHNGQPYDSKAIAGVAHQYLPGRAPLKSDEFSGGEDAAAGRLRELGFEIKGPNEQFPSVPTFEPGGVYNRVHDIHDFYGGQRQGGISTPKSAPLIFLFTGETGDQYGYQDGPRNDGTFAYTGEGQIGNMEFTRGNLALRDHTKDGRDLLLFEKINRPGAYRFVGFFACDGFEYAMAPDKNKTMRRVIIFQLRPAVSGEEPEIDKAVQQLQHQTLEELHQRAIADANMLPHEKKILRSYIERSASVRAYVLKRANGICESCATRAPFKRSNGQPYLEPHHTRRLADGGPDHPRWVGAVCPDCHREIHYGENGRIKNRTLTEKLALLEKDLDEPGF